MFYCRVKSGFHKVIADPSHPVGTLFELLPPGKRYRSLCYSEVSSRNSNSLYPTAVRVLNDVGPSKVDRAQIASAARRLKKERKISDTWTASGNVMVKTLQNVISQLIVKKDIHKY